MIWGIGKMEKKRVHAELGMRWNYWGVN